MKFLLTGRLVTNLNDVMQGKSPRTPSFDRIARKPGTLRGLIKDTQGKPVPGARVLARTSAFGGLGSSASATSDARGYYEIPLPRGIARVWCGGVAVPYQGVRLALSLHPADGVLDDFVVKDGGIEHFVLRTWGVVSLDAITDNPIYSGNYYGGSFTVSYSTREADDENALKSWLVLGSTIELQTIPVGPLLDGSIGEALVVRQKLDGKVYFQVNNVPIGRYKIQAVVIEPSGKTSPLRLKDNSRQDLPGGLTPKVTDGPATLLFRSDGGTPNTLRIPGGNMARMELLAELAG